MNAKRHTQTPLESTAIVRFSQNQMRRPAAISFPRSLTVIAALTTTLAVVLAGPVFAQGGAHSEPGWFGDPNDPYTESREWGFEDPESVGDPGTEGWSPPADNPDNQHGGPEPDWSTDNPDGVSQEEVSGDGCLKITAGTTVTIQFHNAKITDNQKEIWLQYEYMMTGANSAPEFEFPPGLDSVTKTKDPRDEYAGGYWYRRTRGYTIKPQPEWEAVKFTVHSGALWIRKLKFGSHCTEQLYCEGSHQMYSFAYPDWSPVPDASDLPDGYDETQWSRYGSCPPAWMPEVTDHEGVIGVPGGGGAPADGGLTAWFDANEYAEDDRHVCYQFDFYNAEGGEIYWEEMLPPGSTVVYRHEEYEELFDGWQRVAVTFDVAPPPDWVEFNWYMFTDGVPGAPVVIDNLVISSASSVRKLPQPVVPLRVERSPMSRVGGLLPAPEPQWWTESFDDYDLGSGLHGQGGWKGWDNDPSFDAFVSDVQARSEPQAVEIEVDADLVREFEGCASGRWSFTTWQYIPSDFVSGGDDQFAGTYFILLNTYVDGGPHEESDWSVQMQCDSNDGMLKVFYGDGLNTIDVPYVTDQWVRIEVDIDLDNDLVQIRYGDIEFEPYAWTGGVLGGGGGALNIAAVDLCANGSSPVYYDDFDLSTVD